MITAEQIQLAESTLDLSESQQVKGDNVRIVYEWLDAQRMTNTQSGKKFALKYLIGLWSGRKISENDIHIAAYLHNGLKGVYPSYNLHPRLTFPSFERLRWNIDVRAQGYEEIHLLENYRFYEIVKYDRDGNNELIRSYFSESLPEQQVEGLDYCDINDCECYYCVYGR